MASTETAAPPAIELIEALQSVQGKLESALEPLGLSLAKLGLLDKLAKAGGPVPLRTLPELCACVRSNITQLVDRLEAAGLVERTDDPDDRRQKRAEITEAGRASHAEGVRVLLEAEEQLFSGLSTERRDALLGMLRALRV
jgi:DNA-binding MarR family transcriptional regulator